MSNVVILNMKIKESANLFNWFQWMCKNLSEQSIYKDLNEGIFSAKVDFGKKKRKLIRRI